MGAISVPGLERVGPCAQGRARVSHSTVLWSPRPMPSWAKKGRPESSTMPLGTHASMVWINATGRSAYRSVCSHWWASASNLRGVLSSCSKNRGQWVFSFEAKRFLVALPRMRLWWPELRETIQPSGAFHGSRAFMRDGVSCWGWFRGHETKRCLAQVGCFDCDWRRGSELLTLTLTHWWGEWAYCLPRWVSEPDSLLKSCPSGGCWSDSRFYALQAQKQRTAERVGPGGRPRTMRARV